MTSKPSYFDEPDNEPAWVLWAETVLAVACLAVLAFIPRKK